MSDPREPWLANLEAFRADGLLDRWETCQHPGIACTYPSADGYYLCTRGAVLLSPTSGAGLCSQHATAFINELSNLALIVIHIIDDRLNFMGDNLAAEVAEYLRPL